MANRYIGRFVIETAAGRAVAVEVREFPRAFGDSWYSAAHVKVSECAPGAPADFHAPSRQWVNVYATPALTPRDPGTAVQRAISSASDALPSGDYIQCVRPEALSGYSEAILRAAEAHTARERLATTLGDTTALLETASQVVSDARARTAEALAERDSARAEAAELREALSMLSLGSA